MSRPFREAGAAAVFHVDLAPHSGRETEALAWLDAPERARRRRFLYAAPRREFTLCRAALRELLCRRLGCGNDRLSFAVSRRSKPFALVGGSPASIAFNVSHSGKHGLIALAPAGRIGVDLEERSRRRDLDAYIRLLFAPHERAELEAADAERKVDLFYSLWTMKEALVKAVGAGLAIDTTGFEIPPVLYRGARSHAALFRFPGSPSVTWRLENLSTESFAAALSYELPALPGASRRRRFDRPIGFAARRSPGG